jgi:uncharacterized membrane protein YphA (DoxX/SURF4 family)
MLAAIFIQGGIAALRYPQAHIQTAKPVLDAVKPVLQQATETAAPTIDKAAGSVPVDLPPTSTNWMDDETLVRIDGGVKVVAGTMLALGKAPRLASTALAASLIPTTLAGHRFWEQSDPETRTADQINFFKNLSLLGGLLIAAADTEGKPSLAWRGRKAAKLAAVAASTQAGAVSGAVEDVSGLVSGAVQDLSGKVSGAAEEVTGRLSGSGSEASGAVKGLAAGAAGLLPAAVSARSKAGKRAEKRGAKLQKVAEKRAGAWQEAAQERAAELQKAAEKQSRRLQKRAAKRSDKLSQRVERKRQELAKKAPGFFDQVVEQAGKLGHDVATRASAVGSEVAQQAEGAAKDTRKRVATLSR